MNFVRQKLSKVPLELIEENELLVGGNEIIELPNNLLNSITKIDAFHNKLETLPDKLPNNLKYLYVAMNNLKRLPQKLPHNLTALDIELNDNLNDICAIWNCPNLISIEFNQKHLYNEIKTFCKVTNCSMLYYPNRSAKDFY